MGSKELSFLRKRGSLQEPLSVPDGPAAGAVSLKAASEGTAYSAHTLSRCSAAEARSFLPFETARKLRVLPLGVFGLNGEKLLSVAVPAKFKPELVAELRFAVGLAVKVTEVPESILEEAVFNAYHGDGQALREGLRLLNSAETKPAALKAPLAMPNLRSAGGEAGAFLMAVVDYALSQKASDLHIIPKRNGCFVRLRIRGEMYDHEQPVCSLEKHCQLIARLKVLGGLDTTARNAPQDGSFSFEAYGSDTHNARISLMPTVNGEKAVIRFLSSGSIMALQHIGLDQRTLHGLGAFMEAAEGMVLFAGPTGSGKTTTMYSVMQELGRRNLSLVSIENPVEIRLPCVAQTAIDEKAGLDYAACLKSVVRQDPDVILLGEIRDPDSAKAALQAALTGHLLLSTVHARNVFEVFLRLAGFGIDNLSIAQALNMIVCQKLLPRLCEKCRVFDLTAANRFKSEIYQAVGCKYCDYSGYDGQILAVESLSIDSKISEIITGGQLNRSALLAACNESNYSSGEAALERILSQGRISFEQFRQTQPHI